MDPFARHLLHSVTISRAIEFSNSRVFSTSEMRNEMLHLLLCMGHRHRHRFPSVYSIYTWCLVIYSKVTSIWESDPEVLLLHFHLIVIMPKHILVTSVLVFLNKFSNFSHFLNWIPDEEKRLHYTLLSSSCVAFRQRFLLLFYYLTSFTGMVAWFSD